MGVIEVYRFTEFWGIFLYMGLEYLTVTEETVSALILTCYMLVG